MHCEAALATYVVADLLVPWRNFFGCHVEDLWGGNLEPWWWPISLAVAQYMNYLGVSLVDIV